MIPGHEAWSGSAGPGSARQRKAPPGVVRRGKAGAVFQQVADILYGGAWQGEPGSGAARSGLARCGKAWVR